MKEQVEKDLRLFLETWSCPQPLWEACSYALLAPAKRFRPILVYQVAKAVGKRCDVSQAAVAVELFHTASLIADDLPCMDDDETRRGCLALHKKKGEATALLATYALIAAGYECVAANAKDRNLQVCQKAIAAVSKCTGAQGATGGQYWDLFEPADHLEEMIAMKTGSLFELSFVLGWLFGGGDVEQLPTVEAAAHHFGMAFQVQDDLLDQNEDTKERNFSLLLGEQKAKERISLEKKKYEACLKLLGIKLELAPALV